MSKTNRPANLVKIADGHYETSDGKVIVELRTKTTSKTVRGPGVFVKRRVSVTDRWYNVRRRGAAAFDSVMADTLEIAGFRAAELASK